MEDTPTALSLRELLAWAAAEADLMRRELPATIHSRNSGDREDWGLLSPHAISGPPFSRAFLAYVNRDLDGRRPVVRALWQMRAQAAPGPQRQMFRVCLALLQGEEPAQIRRRLRLSEFAFAVTALQGLSTLRTRVEDGPRLTEQNAVAA